MQEQGNTLMVSGQNDEKLPGNHGQFGEGDGSEAFKPLENHPGGPADVDDGKDIDDAVARRHKVSVGAVRVLRDALRRGGGRQAQFSHPDLGGMGQWSAGGMTQVGDMFNTALRDRVNELCTELAQLVPPAPSHKGYEAARDWWPSGLGQPSATGAQNGMQYACFPEARRVAIEQAGTVTVYDSGDHRISGVSQSQSTTQELIFSSQKGQIRASELPVAG